MPKMLKQKEVAPSSSELAGPKDVFLHLFAIIMLYISAVNFLILIFQCINILIPDPLQQARSFAASAAYDKIRFAIASLIVVFPAYLYSTVMLNRTYRAAPAKRNLKIRKWLIYFTLFVASLIIVGDIVSLVFKFLGGELTVKFIAKVLTVLFVAAAIFVYYLWEMRRYDKKEA